MAFISIVGLKDLERITKQLEKFPDAVQNDALRKVHTRYNRDIKRFAQNFARRRRFPRNHRSEDLASTISVRKRGRLQSQIIVSASYAAATETGTKPRTRAGYRRIPIQLRRGWRGNTTSPYIRHPGSKGYPAHRFMSRAIEKADRKFPQTAKQVDSFMRKWFK